MPMNFGFSPAGQALGLGGTADGSVGGLGNDLMNQVAGETDDDRKKRLAQMQQARQMGLSGSTGSTATSAAGTALGRLARLTAGPSMARLADSAAQAAA
jgi:hypothetical protein